MHFELCNLGSDRFAQVDSGDHCVIHEGLLLLLARIWCSDGPKTDGYVDEFHSHGTVCVTF